MVLLIGKFLVALVFALLALPASAASNQLFQPAALQADLRFTLETIKNQHPDLSHSITIENLDREAEIVLRQLDRPMNQIEAWATLAQLNPSLADGHLFIGLPGWRAQSKEAIRQGIGFFPFEVELDARGYPVITAALGGSATSLAGQRITRINGRPARTVVRTLLARLHGDTPVFRAALLSQRWWLIHSKLYGTPASYNLALDGARLTRSFPAGHALPAVLQQEASFERLFDCHIGADGTARLMVGSFSWEDKGRYFLFTQDCFARMRAASTTSLVIDISANSGGDDDMWKDGILRYIATSPYRHGSTYLKRERAGEVTAGAIESTTEPVTNEPHHFAGKVTVVIGPLTYSSAVLFGNVVRDYKFGTLTGTGNSARTRQSGGVQSVVMPNTGLTLSYPRFVLAPPCREECSGLSYAYNSAVISSLRLSPNISDLLATEMLP